MGRGRGVLAASLYYSAHVFCPHNDGQWTRDLAGDALSVASPIIFPAISVICTYIRTWASVTNKPYFLSIKVVPALWMRTRI